MAKDKVIELTLQQFLELIMGPDYDPTDVDKVKKVIQNKYDFIHLSDVRNGNPNGDPDANNMPRIDPDTLLGIITDVCIKRKIRDFIDMLMHNKDGYRIYIKNDAYLNDKDNEAFAAVGVTPGKKNSKLSVTETERKLAQFMCDNFYDIRTFGAVMTGFTKEGLACGRMRGPVQMSCGNSIDPIQPIELSITRQVQTSQKEKKDADGNEKDGGRSGTFGNKFIIPYALYRMEGHVSANLAQHNTGFSEDDLAKLWFALMNMFEDDHSAARGEMATRELIIFRHNSIYGNAPAFKLFDAVRVENITDGPARSFRDYKVTIDEDAIPDGVTCYRIR